ncbi:aminotransferase class I/II-fold pyridoxal phosphate-dependent enzyme [Oceanibacterium hippocampi]|uniref:Biodegradative arginine decarboxylase n=1 Tax=Oceanibacterium hippocampi TaxID=745714 RepID=A0A1Y5TDI2_9PROT|nr:aminotransferase class I/II-fold pyridoxal phosphate-dependent enzyme [Oceanibacterium hippocampi]SLN61540.1 Biodegradative arginine decarboxylase [Oceanibacterium hippocampi]
MNDSPIVRSGHSIAEYYSAVQVRTDRWSDLRETAQRISRERSDIRRSDLVAKAVALLDSLEPIEIYWAFPGAEGFTVLRDLLHRGRYDDFAFGTRRISRALQSGAYRRRTIPLHEESQDDDSEPDSLEARAHAKPYFEVLIVDLLTAAQEHALHRSLDDMRRHEDPFVYRAVVVPSLEDALIAVMFNHNIQSVVVRHGFDLRSRNELKVLKRYLSEVGEIQIDDIPMQDLGPALCRMISRVRPELDLFLVTDRSVEDIAGRDLGSCRRVFYNQEDFNELHLNILRGVAARYETPFFSALKAYSRQPTGVFHALPISRGKSITRSHWIQDMGEFYGANIFHAETSATSGGLDSLLEPHGPIKKAQELATRAFGSKKTVFATNGTSTCNKIVVQALVRPGDIILVDRDCHKSHHYGMVLAGAHVVYLDSYPLQPYSMYGAVPLKEIKRRLLELKRAGKLDRVRMLLLTNCTFDGIVYNVERVMEECLAIKPDLVFLWDEAWFAFARFGPTYRQRTAMYCADLLRDRFRDPDYRARCAAQAKTLKDADDETLLATRLLPDPDRTRVRVYATQSTHKTLTSLRQGSMIHIHDQNFRGEVEEAFHEAYMTHTSTSPNYQIIASLDVGRRQVELEGFEFVQKQIEAAMAMRRSISTNPLLCKYFKVLTVADLIPSEYRESGIKSYFDPEHGWNDAWDAWAQDEFTLDASRITLAVGATGFDGDTFKNKTLMDRFGIQVNKTSRNTVLFMTNIGTTRSSVAYLIEVLVEVAREIDDQIEDASPTERKVFERRVRSLNEDLPPLPDFSRFHEAFRARDGSDTPEGDLREAFFLAYDDGNCEHLSLDDGSLDAAMESGREVVSTAFIIPYPPGFPILVPGQVISAEILRFMRALDVKEIHGYRPELGLRVFTEEALKKLLSRRSAAGKRKAAG